MGTGELNAGGNLVRLTSYLGKQKYIVLVATSYRNQDKLWPDGPLGSYTYADFILISLFVTRKQ